MSVSNISKLVFKLQGQLDALYAYIKSNAPNMPDDVANQIKLTINSIVEHETKIKTLLILMFGITLMALLFMSIGIISLRSQKSGQEDEKA